MKEIALHILDIAQNSISAGASIVNIELLENISDDILHLKISDNGKGMDENTVNNVTDPYFTTRRTRKVGLGIPLLKHSAEQAGGSFMISSIPGQGTEISAIFCHSHIDRPPVGDIAGVISILAGANPEIDFIYRHAIDGADYTFNTIELKEVLEEVPLSEHAVIRYMKEMIEDNLKSLSDT